MARSIVDGARVSPWLSNDLRFAECTGVFLTRVLDLRISLDKSYASTLASSAVTATFDDIAKWLPSTAFEPHHLHVFER